MRKSAVLFVAIVLALLCMVPAAPASPGRYTPPEPLVGLMDIAYADEPCPVVPPDTGDLITIGDPTGCWFGTIEGDIIGTIAFWEMDANYVAGMWERFFEVMLIEPDAGGYIYGIQKGTWSFKTLEFSTSGWVTGTSDEWSDLLGYRFHEAGITSDPDLGLPITGDDTAWSMSKPGSPVS